MRWTVSPIISATFQTHLPSVFSSFTKALPCLSRSTLNGFGRIRSVPAKWWRSGWKINEPAAGSVVPSLLGRRMLMLIAVVAISFLSLGRVPGGM